MGSPLAVEIGLRLRQAREGMLPSMTANAFAKALGLLSSTYYNYEKGVNGPPVKVLLKASQVTGRTFIWLSTGKEVGELPELQRSGSQDQVVARIVREAIAEYGQRSAAPEVTLQIVSGKEAGEIESRFSQFAAVPIVPDAAAAGCPRTVREIDAGEIEEYVIIYRKWAGEPGHFACLRIAGDSMVPVLADGSLVGVNLAARDPRKLKGKIVAARIEDGVVVKFLSFDRRHLVFSSANPAFEPIIVEAGDQEQVGIIGRVEWSWTKFPF